jgi:hypothetical protein
MHMYRSIWILNERQDILAQEKKNKVPYIPIGVSATANLVSEIQLVTKQLPNLTESIMKVMVLWDVMLCCSVKL